MMPTILQCSKCNVTVVDDNDPGPGTPNTWLIAHMKVCPGNGTEPVAVDAEFTKTTFAEAFATHASKAAGKVAEKAVKDVLKDVTNNLFKKGRR